MRRPLYHDLMGHKGGPELCLDCRLNPEPVRHQVVGWDDQDLDERCGQCGEGFAIGEPVRRRLRKLWHAVCWEEVTRITQPDEEERFALTVRGWAASSDGVEQHAFSKAAEPVLQRALDLVTERGGTHGDTWRLPMVTAFLDHVLALKGIVIDDPEWKRLLIDSVFIDMKDARFARGEWEPDDLDDGGNYRATFTSWRAEYEQKEDKG